MVRKRIIFLISSMVLFAGSACAAPVGNVADPFTINQGVFGDFGFFIRGDHETRDRTFYSQDTQITRIQKNNFQTIGLTRRREDGTLSSEAILREGDQVRIPLQHDATGLFTLTLRDGDIAQLKSQLGDKGALVQKKTTFTQEGVTCGISYKNRFYFYGSMGSGSISTHTPVTWRVIETHGVTVLPQEGAEADETTKAVIDKITYDWENESNAFTIDTRYETETGIVWGLGASAVMFETPFINGDTLRTGLNVNYRKLDLSVKKTVAPLQDSSAGLQENLELSSAYSWDVDEYQFAIGIAYDMFRAIPWTTRVSPYAGAVFAYINGTEKHTLSNPVATDNENSVIPVFIISSDIEMVESIGYYAGVSVDLLDIATLCVERRMQDESSSHLSFLIKF